MIWWLVAAIWGGSGLVTIVYVGIEERANRIRARRRSTPPEPIALTEAEVRTARDAA